MSVHNAYVKHSMAISKLGAQTIGQAGPTLLTKSLLRYINWPDLNLNSSLTKHSVLEYLLFDLY